MSFKGFFSGRKHPVSLPVIVSARYLFWFFCFSFLLFLGRIPLGYASWREMTTPHFEVIFPEGLKREAQEVASIAEETLPALEQFLEAPLSFRPAIVLWDKSDIPQGYTDPLQGEIHLFVAEPYEVLSNGARFQSWLRMVLAHELTHLLHLGTVGENLKFLQSLLGRVVLPNVVQPFWVWEGYAMYGEGKINEREVVPSLYWMMLRTQALEGELPPHHFFRGYSFFPEWPGRLSVYVYGASVIDYIARTFGEEKLAELSLRRSRDPGLFGFERAVKEVLGIPVGELWRRFQEEVKRRAQRERAEVNITPVELLTDEGYSTGGVALSPDEEDLFYSLSHPDFRAGLRVKNFQTKRKKLLLRGFVLGKPSFSPDGTKLVYAKMAPGRKTSFSDLYLYDFSQKRERRLTFQERAFSPAFWGDQILFLRRNRFPEGVFALDPESDLREPLFAFDRDFRPVTLVTSGELVAVSGWRRGGMEIDLLDLKERTLIPLVSGVDLWPIFSLHGRYLLFSAAPGGVFDAFALDLESGAFFRLTRVASGFFEPVLGEKGLYGLLYTREGFKVGFVPRECLLWERVTFPAPLRGEEKAPAPTFSSYPEAPYRSWRWLSPRYFVPLPGGFSVTARDPLGLHEYSLSYEGKPDGTWSGDFSYRGNWMEAEVAVNIHREEEKWTYGVTLNYPLVVEETWGSTLSAGYERFVREDSLYPGYWEGWFGRIETSFSGGNDRFLSDFESTLSYRQGFLGNLKTESVVATLQGRWQRAGDSSLSFGFDAALGVHNLPRFFTLGGWKAPWQVAGYPEATLRGKIAGKMHLEVTSRLATFNMPLLSMGMVRDLTGTLFLEGGFAGETFAESPFLFSAGGELTLRAFLAEEIPLTFTLGYAQPLSVERPGEWYLELGVRFR